VPVQDAAIKDALLHGVEELKADPKEGKFDSWLAKADLCGSEHWLGVTCEYHGQKRIGINIVLENEKGFVTPLRGKLPAAWGALGPALCSLALTYGWKYPWRYETNTSCQLAEPYVQTTWSNLTQLRRVDLINLGLQGTVPLQVFANMPRLRYLGLAHNQFTALPTLLPGQFSKLLSLGLAYNMLHGKVPASYGQTFKSLTGLGLDHNQLDTLKLGAEDFPDLGGLGMSHNNLTGRMPNVLLLKSLTNADFSHNSLTVLPDIWWHNMPTGNLLHRHSNNLLEVIASHNKISGLLPPLVSSEGANGTVRLAADLSFNQLSGSISAGTRKAGTNRHGYLVAANNHLTGTLPVNLMDWFSGAVDLSHNLLSDSCCPEAWYRWKDLTGLYLEHNALRGPLPATYSNWSNLIELDLSSNPLNTTIPPVFLGTNEYKQWYSGDKLDTVCGVYLNNCSLQGTLPTAWLQSFIVNGRSLAIHDNPDLGGCLPPPRICDHNAPHPFCVQSKTTLVRRSASCQSCFNQLWDLRSAALWPVRHSPLPRHDCDQISELGYTWYANQSCDTLFAWPNASSAIGAACSREWCAALAGMRITAVCPA
jgi:Leucine-rich repeat (LRR) protein